ncbi:Protein TusC [Candidatus Hartigia pinicola]|nr:Protein TusC [Candidatus Hartigia pinicola]
MKKFAFVFLSTPHGNASGREGLDALLATSALTNNINVFFLSDGVCQLLANQDPNKILSRDYISTFKILSLYDIKNIYLCAHSLKERGISEDSKWIVDVDIISNTKIINKLSHCDIVLKF